MTTSVRHRFSYDPFDPAVMADPLPYYRVLRDEHPVYYVEKWDTYALSRFSDIWQVLEINDGTFVEERQPHMRGGTHEPLTRQDIEEKFALCARHGGFDTARTAQALALLRGLYDGRIDLASLRG